jgi:hypothetical protein
VNETLGFDPEAVHRHYSAECFNRAWDYIGKSDLSADDVDRMLDAAHASAWHWSQRPDRTTENDSIAFWQLARVYALAGDAPMAAHYGERCLAASQGLQPFYVGYAYEALARAALVADDHVHLADYMASARGWLEQVTDAESRAMLQADLDGLIT